jgi:hypothetical protein
VWELIFLMVIMKIPIIYLCWVVYWAVKSKPEPEGGEPLGVVAPVPGPAPSRDRGSSRRRPRPMRPHGAPTRGYPRTPRVARTRAG